MRRLTSVVVGAMVLAGLVTLPAGPAAAAPPPPTIEIWGSGYTCDVPEARGNAQPGDTVTLFESTAGQVGSTVVNDDGHWYLTPDVHARGAYDLWAVASDATGESAPSDHVGFYYDGRRAIARFEASPGVISPRNHDGVRDTMTISTVVNSPDGGIEVTVFDPTRNEAVQDYSLGGYPQRDTVYSWTWDGRDWRGNPVPSGTYIVGVDWTPEDDGACSPDWDYLDVTVDNSGPSLASFTRSVATFYPRRDDAFGAFRNTVTLTGTELDEPAWVRAQLFRHGSTTALRSVALGHHDAGTSASWAWNGRRTDGSLLPEGSYDIRFRLLDDVGNASYTPRVAVALSHKHVVAHTVTRTKAAADYATTVRTATPCTPTGASRALSSYDRGLLVRYCGDGPGDAFGVQWLFAAPTAAVYDTITPFAYGKARTTDAHLPFLLRNYRDGGATPLGTAGPAAGRHTLTATPGGPHVSAQHGIRLVARPAGTGRLAYDLRTLGVTIRYGTLTH